MWSDGTRYACRYVYRRRAIIITIITITIVARTHTHTHYIIITHNIIRLRARPEQLLGENGFSRANSRDIGTGLWPVELFLLGLRPDRVAVRRFAASGLSRPGSARHVFRRRHRRILLALYLGRGIPTHLSIPIPAAYSERARFLVCKTTIYY